MTTLRKLVACHAWANDEVLAAIAHLPEDNLHTALRLMNHTYVVARIFAGHLDGTPHGYASGNTDHTPTRESLRDDMARSDAWYADYVAQASPEALADPVSFTFTDGDKGCMTREEMIMHVVLHAGNHRGEVGRLLWQARHTPPWDTFAVFLHRTEPGRRLGKAAA